MSNPTVDGVFLIESAPFWETIECIVGSIDAIVQSRRENFTGSLAALNQQHNFCRPHLITGTRMVEIGFRIGGNARILTAHFRNPDYKELAPGGKLLLTIGDDDEGQALIYVLVPRLSDLLQVPTWIYSEKQEKVLWQNRL